jgi:hypothetical protein
MGNNNNNIIICNDERLYFGFAGYVRVENRSRERP